VRACEKYHIDYIKYIRVDETSGKVKIDTTSLRHINVKKLRHINVKN